MALVDENSVRLQGPGGSSATIAFLGATVASWIRELPCTDRGEATTISRELIDVVYYIYNYVLQPKMERSDCSSPINHP